MVVNLHVLCVSLVLPVTLEIIKHLIPLFQSLLHIFLNTLPLDAAESTVAAPVAPPVDSPGNARRLVQNHPSHANDRGIDKVAHFLEAAVVRRGWPAVQQVIFEAVAAALPNDPQPLTSVVHDVAARVALNLSSVGLCDTESDATGRNPSHDVTAFAGVVGFATHILNQPIVSRGPSSRDEMENFQKQLSSLMLKHVTTAEVIISASSTLARAVMAILPCVHEDARARQAFETLQADPGEGQLDAVFRASLRVKEIFIDYDMMAQPCCPMSRTPALLSPVWRLLRRIVTTQREVTADVEAAQSSATEGQDRSTLVVTGALMIAALLEGGELLAEGRVDGSEEERRIRKVE